MNIDRKWLREALNWISVFGQIGFQVVCPPILLCLLAGWLRKSLGVGAWVTFVAIILGLACAFISVARLCKAFLLKNKKEQEKSSEVSYRKHI